MMKQLCLILLFSLSSLLQQVFAQDDGGVSIGKGNQDADASAILELVSETKGLLIPRMTSSQREGIDSPARGLLVYDIDESNFYYYSSTGWKTIGEGVASTIGISEPVNGVKNGDFFYNTSEDLLYVYVNDSWSVAGSKNQVLNLDGTTLKLLQEGESSGSQVDLSALKQSLSLSGTSIGISGGNNIELSSLFNASSISVKPSGDLISGNVQAALEELQADIAALGAGSGDMKKTIYDTDDDGVVENAKTAQISVNSQTVNNLTVETAVPSGAVFTDNQRLYYDNVSRQITISNGNSIQLPVSATGGDMSMSVYDTNRDNIVDLAATVANGGVSSGSIAPGAVTNSKIASGAIAESNLSGITATGINGQVLTSDGVGGFLWRNAASGSVTLSGDITGNSSATSIASGVIIPTDLNSSNNPANGQFLSYDGNTSSFKWTSSSSSGLGTISFTGDLSGSLNSSTGELNATLVGNSVNSATIVDGSIAEEDLDISNAPVNGHVLTYNNGLVWSASSGGIGSITLSGDVSSGTSTNGAVSTSLATGAVTESKIGTDAVTSVKIKNGTLLPVDLDATGSPTAGSVLTYNASSGFEWKALDAITSISLGGELSGSYSSGTLMGYIDNNAIIADKIAVGAVTSAKILDGTIAPSDLKVTGSPSSGSVLTYSSNSGFAWGSSSGSGISSITLSGDVSSITSTTGTVSTTIEPGTVTESKIGTGAVTSDKIADATITPSDLNVSGTPAAGNVLTFNSSSGFAWGSISSGGALNVTVEQAGNYTASNTDDIILFTGTNQHTLTLPTSGILVGKIFYISNSGSGGVTLFPNPREQSAQTINGGLGAILMFVGSGQYAVLSSY